MGHGRWRGDKDMAAATRLRVGILPAVGSGLGSMARTGQLGRLYRHLSHYVDEASLTYFSGLPYADEVQHWKPFYQQTGSALWPVPSGIRAGFLWPLRDPVARQMNVFRAMSLLGAVPALMARWRWGIPFVVSHGADYEAIAAIHGRPAWKWQWLRQLVFRWAAAVIVPSEPMAIRLQARFPKTKIVYIPNWVDTEMFRPFGYNDGKIAVYVGRLVAEKNLQRAARALGKSGWIFLCIGEGPDRAILEGMGVICTGASSWESLPSVLNGASLFVLPSLSEGHPKALIEAMACGLACAVSDRVEGVIQDSRNGVVFGAEDERDMEGVFRRLIRTPSFRAELGRQARHNAVERYDIKKVLPQEVALVKGCAS